MSRKVFLVVVSVIATTVGTLAALLPAALLESKGVVANAAANVWMREVGIALIAMGFIAFRVRGQPDSPTLRAFMPGNAGWQLGRAGVRALYPEAPETGVARHRSRTTAP